MNIKQTGHIKLSQSVNNNYTFIIPVSITHQCVDLSPIKSLYYFAGEGWIPLGNDNSEFQWETFFEDPYEDDVLEIVTKFCNNVLQRFFEDKKFTQRLFVVSTTHITQKDAQLLCSNDNDDSTLIVDNYPGGHLIHLPIDDDDKIPDEYSEAFKNLIKLAKTLGYDLLKLDQDGSIYPDIKTFDW